MASSTPRQGKVAPPDNFVQTNPPPSYDQFAVMQSLIEVQKDLATLNANTTRIAADVQKISDSNDKIRDKIGRAEGIGAGVILVLVVVAGLFWWAFGTPITYIKDQLVPSQPQITLPAANTQPSSD